MRCSNVQCSIVCYGVTFEAPFHLILHLKEFDPWNRQHVRCNHAVVSSFYASPFSFYALKCLICISLSLYIYIYIYMYMYIYIYIYIYRCVHIKTNIYIYIYICRDIMLVLYNAIPQFLRPRSE